MGHRGLKSTMVYLKGAHTTLSEVLAKARFWERVAGTPINERQRMMLNRCSMASKGN
jgi:hypothetical protein